MKRYDYKYDHSEKGKARIFRYEQTSERKYKKLLNNLHYRMKSRTQRIQQLEAELEGVFRG